jgi:hypothetical protein
VSLILRGKDNRTKSPNSVILQIEFSSPPELAAQSEPVLKAAATQRIRTNPDEFISSCP